MGLPSIEIVGEHGACAVTAYVAQHRTFDHDDWWDDFGLRITHSGWWQGATLKYTERAVDNLGNITDTPMSVPIGFAKGDRVTTYEELENFTFGEGVFFTSSPLEEFPITYSVINCRITFERAYLYGRWPLCDESTGEILRNANGEIVRGIWWQ